MLVRALLFLGLVAGPLAATLATAPATPATGSQPADGANAPEAPDPRALLRGVAEHLSSLRAFSFDYTAVRASTSDGKRTEEEWRYAASVQRPGQVALRFQGGRPGVTLVCDGQDLVVHLPRGNVYVVRPAPQETGGFWAAVPYVGAGYFDAVNTPGIRTVLADDPLAIVEPLMERLRYLGSEEVNRVRTHHLASEMNGQGIELWIAATDPAVLVQASFKVSLGATPPDDQPSEWQFVTRFSGWRSHDRLPADHFEFTPPARACQVADLDEALEFAAALHTPDDEVGHADLLGRPAPAFRLELLEGGTLDLAEVVEQGKVVVLAFWATGCPACHAELPVLADMAGEYGPERVAFYAVIFREARETVEAFLGQTGLPMPVALDTAGAVAHQFGVGGIPQTVLLGKDGTVQAVHAGAADDTRARLGDQIDALLDGQTLAVVPAVGPAGADGPEGTAAGAPIDPHRPPAPMAAQELARHTLDRAGAAYAALDSYQDTVQLAFRPGAVPGNTEAIVEPARGPAMRLTFKRPNRFRLENDDLALIGDGVTFWIFSPAWGQYVEGPQPADAAAGFADRRTYFSYTAGHPVLSVLLRRPEGAEDFFHEPFEVTAACPRDFQGRPGVLVCGLIGRQQDDHRAALSLWFDGGTGLIGYTRSDVERPAEPRGTDAAPAGGEPGATAGAPSSLVTWASVLREISTDALASDAAFAFAPDPEDARVSWFGQGPSLHEPERLAVLPPDREVVIHTALSPRMIFGKRHARNEFLELRAQDAEPYVAAVRSAMTKYPPTVLRAHLYAVQLVEAMQVHDLPYGGTCSPTCVYIACGDQLPGPGRTAEVQWAFHHEFATILQEAHPGAFDEAKWVAQNPEGFTYVGDGREAMRQVRVSQPEPEQLLERGFVSQYAQSDVGNDFSEVSAELFSGDPEFWGWMERHPRLRAKVDLAIAFYHAIDPVFTEAYFRALEPAP